MDIYHVRVIQSLVVVVIYFVSKGIIFGLIKRTLTARYLSATRGMAMRKVIDIVFIIISIIFIMLIWGVSQSDLAVFVGSTLTIAGVAFFAQWSLLSNITSSIILFFNHPVRINDRIAIVESAEYIIEGRVLSISMFFTTLLTKDGEELTLPNNIFIQKSIKKLDNRMNESEPWAE